MKYLPSQMDNPCSAPNSEWYAIYTRSKFEKKLHNSLLKSRFESFLPLVKEKRIWSDRIKTIQVPLFPSYVFVKTIQQKFPQIFHMPGFVRFISFEGKPCPIKSREIDLLMQIVQQGYKVEPSITCKIGDRVRIAKGPLKGWEGKVCKTNGGSRIIFNFEGIQQSVSVEVDMGDLEHVSASRH